MATMLKPGYALDVRGIAESMMAPGLSAKLAESMMPSFSAKLAEIASIKGAAGVAGLIDAKSIKELMGHGWRRIYSTVSGADEAVVYLIAQGTLFYDGNGMLRMKRPSVVNPTGDPVS